ncbi:MAG: 3'(2'),5'-bisphosphate nucleotidase CysQ [Flavobacteriaceae bacterium]|nr:3'(2'),5'-bisphosphate nucleotidase CysQ [Flavobacteriaceae bacterium]
MLKISKELKIALMASVEAGAAIMKVYDTIFEVEYKDDNSPLTQADKQANDIINAHLVNTEFPIISEENKQIHFQERKQWHSCWVVDPVDGTKEFVKRNGEFTVNIALVAKGKPVLGVIYVPATKVLYYADVAQGSAFKAQLESHGASVDTIKNLSKELQPKQNDTNDLQVVGSRSHMNDETLSFVEDLKAEGKNVEIVSKGSSLKFCLIAEGNADIYPRFAPTMEWDTAAGQAICNAVGVNVISQDTLKPLAYNKENLLNPWFLVSRN